jgi:hypothetical protein
MTELNFHIDDDSTWEVLHGCKLCQCEGVCDNFGMCIELALEAKYPDVKNSEPIKKKIKNLYKHKANDMAIELINKEMGKFLRQRMDSKMVAPPKINLTLFEKMCIENLPK